MRGNRKGKPKMNAEDEEVEQKKKDINAMMRDLEKNHKVQYESVFQD